MTNHTDSTAPIKILADGRFVPATDPRTDHAAVLLPAIGLMIHPHSLGTGSETWQRCYDRCRSLRVLGFDDWTLALRKDWNPILDLACYNPAVDTALYPGIRPGWHHTDSDCAWQEKDAAGRSPSAWYVGAGYGGVSYIHRGNDGFALAVRRVGQ